MVCHTLHVAVGISGYHIETALCCAALLEEVNNKFSNILVCRRKPPQPACELNMAPASQILPCDVRITNNLRHNNGKKYFLMAKCYEAVR